MMEMKAGSRGPGRITRHIGKDVTIGSDVKIWHFTYIGDRTVIGRETRIGSLVHIDYDVKIGARCLIEGMVYIPPLSVIGDDVFIGPGVTITNDPYPPSGRLAGVRIGDGAIICAGAVVKAGVKIGRRAVVGMGSIVTKNIPPETVVYGNPSRQRYHLEEYQEKRRRWMGKQPIAGNILTP